MSPCITPLHLSSCQGTEEDVRALDDVIRVDPQALHRLQHSLSFEFAMPLMCAAEAGHPKCLQRLIEQGADLQATDRERRYAIFYAVRSGSAECVEILLSRGATVNFLDDGVPTTRYLEMACQAGFSDVVVVLLRHGAITADPKVLTSTAHPTYQTPIAIAATNGHGQCFKWLLLYGARIDLSDIPNLRRDLVARNCIIKILTEPDFGRATIEQRLDMFRILHEFGFEFTFKDNNVFKLLQRSVHTLPHKGSLEVMSAYIAQLLSTPRTLMSSSRVVIRRALGATHYACKLNELKVAQYDRKISESSLKSYLHFHDA